MPQPCVAPTSRTTSNNWSMKHQHLKVDTSNLQLLLTSSPIPVDTNKSKYLDPASYLDQTHNKIDINAYHLFSPSAYPDLTRVTPAEASQATPGQSFIAATATSAAKHEPKDELTRAIQNTIRRNVQKMHTPAYVVQRADGSLVPPLPSGSPQCSASPFSSSVASPTTVRPGLDAPEIRVRSLPLYIVVPAEGEGEAYVPELLVRTYERAVTGVVLPEVEPVKEWAQVKPVYIPRTVGARSRDV